MIGPVRNFRSMGDCRASTAAGGRVKRALRGGCLMLGVLLAQAYLAPFAAAIDLAAGRQVYEMHCLGCHGPDGRPPSSGVPDFSRGESLQQFDDRLVQSVANGKKLMPAFRRIISERDLVNVVFYLRTLQR